MGRDLEREWESVLARGDPFRRVGPQDQLLVDVDGIGATVDGLVIGVSFLLPVHVPSSSDGIGKNGLLIKWL